MLKNRVRGEQFVGVPITRPPKYKRGRERERGDHQMEVHLRGQLLNYILVIIQTHMETNIQVRKFNHTRTKSYPHVEIDKTMEEFKIILFT